MTKQLSVFGSNKSHISRTLAMGSVGVGSYVPVGPSQMMSPLLHNEDNIEVNVALASPSPSSIPPFPQFKVPCVDPSDISTDLGYATPLTSGSDRSESESLCWLASYGWGANSPRRCQAVTQDPSTPVSSYRFNKKTLLQRMASRSDKEYKECLRQETPVKCRDLAVNLASISMGHTATISFSVVCHTNFGEEVRVVGNVPELGQWHPDRALTMTWSDGNVWQATVEVEFPPTASGKSFEYKYVIMSQGKVMCWESCDNRNVNQPQGRSSLTVRNVWEGI
eukprot:gnl/MRDRNA2_/MRDRNA2_195863_c0_seq1.p1 gnl/MRDRNA2_/MRDRNA2_195863_c0~~gnl/MRDRNA2_/MRDRNA2_195863_c0_seq1.p1  ORF type:complete len:280 (-),score=35.83 gnl/MRDRNA2_/MRDRNA2_195863_c0_seq1:70-909(-)